MTAVLLGFTACRGGGGASGGTGPYMVQTSADNPAPPTPNTINANPAIAYNPQYLTVAPGTTVTFNFFGVQHGVTFTTPGSPNNIPPTMNASVNVVFPTAGTYNFYCPIHNYMTGYVTVQ
jgi:plastocyanin